jgi:phosphoglycolate phosphatase
MTIREVAPKSARKFAQQFDLIVFDWDGTLMDSTAMIASSIQFACGDLGVTPPDDERARHVIGLGLLDALAYAVPDLPPERIPEMAARYRHHYLSRDQELKLFPEVAEMMGELIDRGYYVAVATGKTRVGLDRALARCGFNALFHATRCADETSSKPHPQMLFELIAQLGVEAGRTLMVGDTTHDLQMASNARIAALGVSYGAHAAKLLLDHGPLAVVESSAVLRTWLQTYA